MKSISKKILELRKKRGWSQKDLANQLNVSDKLISKWENDQGTPSVEYLQELCSIFNVGMSAFIDIPKRKRKLSPKAKKGIIISTIVFLVAAFIAGFVVLSVYLFVPMTFKEKYLLNLEMSYRKNFTGTTFNFSISLNGTKEEFIGRYEDGKAEWQYKSGNRVEVLKDNVIYKTTGLTVTKTVYTPTSKSLTKLMDEMMTYYGHDSSEREVGEIPISYIRKSFDTYYFEFYDDYFNFPDELGDYIKIVGKPSGTANIKDGKLSKISMTVEVEYYNPLKLKYEKEKISTSLTFNFGEVGEINPPTNAENAVYDSNSFGEAQSLEEYSNNPDAFFNIKKVEAAPSIYVEQDYKVSGGAVSFKKDGQNFSVSLPKSDCEVKGMDASYNIFYFLEEGNYGNYKYNAYCFNPFTKGNSCIFSNDTYLMYAYFLTNGNVMITDIDRKIHLFDGETRIMLDKTLSGTVIDDSKIDGLWIRGEYSRDDGLYKYDLDFNLITETTFSYDREIMIEYGTQIPNSDMIYYSRKVYDKNLNPIDSSEWTNDKNLFSVNYKGYKIDVTSDYSANSLVLVRFNDGGVEFENISLDIFRVTMVIITGDKLYIYCEGMGSKDCFVELTIKNANEAAA